MEPILFLGEIPATAHARRMLRIRALDLAARLARAGDGPCAVLLNMASAAGVIDAVLLRPHACMVACFQEAEQPFEIRRGHAWLVAARQARAVLVHAAEAQGVAGLLGAVVAAAVVVPGVPAGSQIALDVEEHRERVKVFGLDELAPLLAMLQAGAQLEGQALGTCAAALGGRLWHAAGRFAFEIGVAAYQLRPLQAGRPPLVLLEGANIIGRREQPLQYEYRLTLQQDDAVSADHAILVCAADGRLLLRDTSTNGTVVRLPNGGEQRIHRAELAVGPGALLRFGETALLIERV